MKCRNVDEKNNLVWFGKTGEKDVLKIYRSGQNSWESYSKANDLNNIENYQYVIVNDTVNIKKDDELLTYTIEYVDSYKINCSLSRTVSENVETLSATFSNAPIDNYVSDAESVKASLVQRLSVIKGELWYQINYGLPLTEKYKSKGVYDSSIISIISGHRGVKGVKKFISYIKEGVYYFESTIVTIFNDSEFNIVSSYNF